MFPTSISCLVALSLMSHGLLAQKQPENVITDDTYFYGQSPAVYPTREQSLCISMSHTDLLISGTGRHRIMGRGRSQGQEPGVPVDA